MTKDQIFGLIASGLDTRDIVTRCNISRAEVMEYRDEYNMVSNSEDVKDMTTMDKVEVEKARYTLNHDPIDLKGVELVKATNRDILSLKTESAALKVIEAISECIHNGVTAAELNKLADTTVKINDSFFKEVASQETNIYNMNNQQSAFRQTLKD